MSKQANKAIQTATTEEQARLEISTIAASLQLWERENKAHTDETRKASFADLMEAAKAAGKLMDEDINKVCSSFAAKMIAGGAKMSTTTSRKSELRRILENIQIVPPDASGWNSAIKSIKEATADPLELIRDKCESKLEAIDKAHEAINALVASYQDMLNEARPSGTEAFTVEAVAKMVADAIQAKRQGADVAPKNVAQMLRDNMAPQAEQTVTMNNMKAQAAPAEALAK